MGAEADMARVERNFREGRPTVRVRYTPPTVYCADEKKLPGLNRLDAALENLPDRFWVE